jgi:hypothetical protein
VILGKIFWAKITFTFLSSQPSLLGIDGEIGSATTLLAPCREYWLLKRELTAPAQRGGDVRVVETGSLRPLR